MVTEYKNPFSKIRAEQMGDALWKYYVKPVKEYIGSQPLIFEGSRGTGKTMFFICNSWKEKYAKAKANNIPLKDFLSTEKHIGFYYKVDGRFVKSFCSKDVAEHVWVGIFNTYFNIQITKEIIDFIAILSAENIIDKDLLIPFFKRASQRLKREEVNNLLQLTEIIEGTLIDIELYSNDTSEKQPVGLNSGTIIKDCIEVLKKCSSLNETTFHVFVDEFEELLIDQQVILNTLLKQSNSDLVFDYGVISKGIYTYVTLSGQEIKPKDDFFIWSVDRYDYYEKKDYNTLLSEICKKRLEEELSRNGAVYDDKYLNIEFYLKSYGSNIEDELFAEKTEKIEQLKEKILSIIRKQAIAFQFGETIINEYYNELTNCSPSIMRMHLALLMRKSKGMNVKVICEHKKNQSTEYKDWKHNTLNAAVFLLCKEFGVQKKYHGFNVYSALSSGVIRSFLELAEYAFDYAFSNTKQPFSFKNPRELTMEEQTKAVYFISKKKLNEIDSYEPCGFKLKSFVIALGEIFYAIQTNPETTLGEVGQNHFETKEHELKKFNSEAAELLRYSVRFKILEEDDPTKTKSDDNIEITDYHLNHIYCPTFKISHLRKRKIPISHFDLAKLFCGSQSELREVVRKLSGYTIDETPNLFSGTNELSGKI
jgi:hypothetical protein